jgi:hypothetical protein
MNTYKVINFRMIAGFCVFALLSLCGCIAQGVDIASLTDNAIGPYKRDAIVIDGYFPPDVSDIFHFVLLQGTPLSGQYDWFKISRRPGGSDYYLVLGSSDGKMEWVELGSISSTSKNYTFNFKIIRIADGEGEKVRTTREFSWRKGSPEVRVAITTEHRYFLNPIWSQPKVLRYLIMPNDFRAK